MVSFLARKLLLIRKILVLTPPADSEDRAKRFDCDGHIERTEHDGIV